MANRETRPSDNGPSEFTRDGSNSLDAILQVLSHPHRRTLLRFLSNIDTERTDLSQCVTYLKEHSDSNLDDAVDVALHHTHLPTLDRYGFIEYDPEQSTIQYVGCEQLTKLLQVLEELEG